MSGSGSALSALVEVRRAEVETLTRELARLDARVSDARARLQEVEEAMGRRKDELRTEARAQDERLGQGGVPAAELLRQSVYVEHVAEELRQLRRARDLASKELYALELAARERRRAIVQAAGNRRAAELRREELRREAARAGERRGDALAEDLALARFRESAP